MKAMKWSVTDKLSHRDGIKPNQRIGRPVSRSVHKTLGSGLSLTLCLLTSLAKSTTVAPGVKPTQMPLADDIQAF